VFYYLPGDGRNRLDCVSTLVCDLFKARLLSLQVELRTALSNHPNLLSVFCYGSSYRQLLPVSYVSSELAFETEEKCLEFLTPFGLVFTDVTRSKIDCKASMACLPNI